MSIMPETLHQRTLAGEADTRGVATELAGILKIGDIVALDGVLGAGKTAFARALINALPGPNEDVPSPTFTLVQTYHRGDSEIWHFDLYRLETPEDAVELGIEDAFANAISLIEWPERLGRYLPARHLRISLVADGDAETRTLQIIGNADWRNRLANFSKPDGSKTDKNRRDNKEAGTHIG